MVKKPSFMMPRGVATSLDANLAALAVTDELIYTGVRHQDF